MVKKISKGRLLNVASGHSTDKCTCFCSFFAKDKLNSYGGILTTISIGGIVSGHISKNMMVVPSATVIIATVINEYFAVCKTV